MEKFITATGKSIDLAIEAGLTQLGMDRDSVSVEILETPKSGFFGIGAFIVAFCAVGGLTALWLGWPTGRQSLEDVC